MFPHGGCRGRFMGRPIRGKPGSIPSRIPGRDRLERHRFHDDPAIHLHVQQMLLHVLDRHQQKFRRLARQLLTRQAGMPLPGRPQKRIENTRLDSVIGISQNTHAPGDLVGLLKAHARNIVGQTVRILPDDAVHPRTVFPVNLRGQVHRYPVPLQEDHGLAHVLLLLHLFGDRHGHALADAFYLREPLRFFLDDAEGIRLEAAHDPRGEGRAHPFDGAGTQVPLHGGGVLRRFHFIGFHRQLLAVDRMLRHGSRSRDHLAFADGRKCTDQDELLAVGRNFQDRIAVLFVSEFDFLDKTGHCSHHSAPQNSSQKSLRSASPRSNSMNLPVPTATAVSGSSAIIVVMPVFSSIRASRPLSSAPPPVSTMPRS